MQDLDYSWTQLRIIREKCEEQQRRGISLIYCLGKRPWRGITAATTVRIFRAVLEEIGRGRNSNAYKREMGKKPEWLELSELTSLGEHSMPSISGCSPKKKTNLSCRRFWRDKFRQKYFLSKKACEGILRRAEKRGKKLAGHSWRWH